MRSIIINEKYDNKRIDKIIKEIFPDMPVNALYKAFRKRDIKVNGIRVKEDHIVSNKDKVEIFITDEIIEAVPLKEQISNNKGFSVVYEDDNLLIVNKDQGIAVHPDKEETKNTLIDLVKVYLTAKGEYKPENPDSFTPSLCHRLDRNTGGLVIIAKNNKSLKIILDKIKFKEIKKFYQCLVKGKPEKNSGELKAFLEKDEHNSRVYIHNERKRGSTEIITGYKVLSYENDISRLEVELVTGKTHQIRAHLSYLGHPIIGDGKYSTNAINRPSGFKYQALWACRIVFDFKDAGFLNYLKGKQFEVKPGF
jgi:23S rRNA pseudouridine955/2504/2580 synthase